MRKKSHISLSRYLLDDLENRISRLEQRRYCFYVGSILPDISPAFLYRRHTYESSYGMLLKHIRKLARDLDRHTEDRIRFWIRLGVVMHYLADYCTYPHNSSYEGSMAEHCQYERDLKFALRSYVRGEIPEVFYSADCSSSSREIRQIIETLHEKYLTDTGKLESDCAYIVQMCRSVLNALFRNKYEVAEIK